MRRVVNMNKETGISVVKITHPKTNETLRYELERRRETSGRLLFLEAFTRSGPAIAAAGIAYNPPVKTTLRKADYADQQGGYSRPRK